MICGIKIIKQDDEIRYSKIYHTVHWVMISGVWKKVKETAAQQDEFKIIWYVDYSIITNCYEWKK